MDFNLKEKTIDGFLHLKKIFPIVKSKFKSIEVQHKLSSSLLPNGLIEKCNYNFEIIALKNDKFKMSRIDRLEIINK